MHGDGKAYHTHGKAGNGNDVLHLVLEQIAPCGGEGVGKESSPADPPPYPVLALNWEVRPSRGTEAHSVLLLKTSLATGEGSMMYWGLRLIMIFHICDDLCFMVITGMEVILLHCCASFPCPPSKLEGKDVF